MTDGSQSEPAAGASTASTSVQRAAQTATRAWVAAAAGRLGVTQGTVRRWIRTGRLNPSCGQVYALVMPYLDRELSSQEQAEVEQHLAACPGCEQHFGFDGAVLRFVRQRTPRPTISASLQERLMAPYRGQTPPDS